MCVYIYIKKTMFIYIFVFIISSNEGNLYSLIVTRLVLVLAEMTIVSTASVEACLSGAKSYLIFMLTFEYIYIHCAALRLYQCNHIN